MIAIVQLFANPHSGTYSPRRIAALARAFAEAGAEVIEGEASAMHPPEIDRRATHICVAGGDGTVRHVARALVVSGHAAPLAHYPLGTINLLAREAGYEPHPERFAARFLGTGERRRHYAATLGGDLFLCCASVGPENAAVSGHSAVLKKRIGRFAYALAMIDVLHRWPRPRLTVTANGESIACEAVYVAKGRYFAGPFSFAPAARLTDGLLHVVTLGTARRSDYFAFMWDLVWRRDPGRRRGNRSFTAQNVEIDGPANIGVQADGDILAHLPVVVRTGAEPLEFA